MLPRPADKALVKPVVRPDGLDEIGAEPFLAALVRSSDDAMIGKTPDGQVVVFWDEAAERLYGYQAAEMLGRDISVLVPPDRPVEIAIHNGRGQQGRTVKAFQTERLRKDGAIVPVSVTVSPVIGEDGTVIGASTIAHDLSQEIEHVRALREAETTRREALSTLETLQSSAPIGLGFVDREFRVVHLNEVLAAISGSRARTRSAGRWRRSCPRSGLRSSASTARSSDNDEAVLNIEVTGELAAEPGRSAALAGELLPGPPGDRSHRCGHRGGRCHRAAPGGRVPFGRLEPDG